MLNKQIRNYSKTFTKIRFLDKKNEFTKNNEKLYNLCSIGIIVK